MTINWTLRLVTGTIAREKDTASASTTIYGMTAGDATITARTAHTKQLWIETDSGQTVAARLDHTENVSASPGDRVRVVFADPGGHVVGLTNETLQTTWKWKCPSNAGYLALIAALAFFAMPIMSLIALWRGNSLVGIALLAISAFVIAVPLGRNRTPRRTGCFRPDGGAKGLIAVFGA